MVRGQADRFVIIGEGSLGVAELPLRIAPVIVGCGMVRGQADRFIIIGEGSLEVAEIALS